MASKKPEYQTAVPDEMEERARPGFDVTYQQTIGRVELGGDSNMSPYEAAFALIGRHAQHNEGGGTYSIPGPDEGQTVSVTVGLSDTQETGGGSDVELVVKRMAQYQQGADEAIRALMDKGMLDASESQVIDLRKRVSKWLRTELRQSVRGS